MKNHILNNINIDYDNVKNFYQEMLKVNNINSVKSLGWGSKNSQLIRFDNLFKFIKKDSYNSLLDVGCGVADLINHEFIKDHVNFYHGIDIIKDFINYGTQFNSSKVLIENKSIFDIDIKCKYDIVVASGTLNHLSSFEDKSNYFLLMLNFIRTMFLLSNKYTIFNATSLYAIYNDVKINPECFYIDPSNIFYFCKLLSNKVILIDDYLPHDFTIILEK